MADIARYVALVTSEHADKPNFMAWLTALLTLVDDCTACASAIDGALDLDAAVGVQLDIVGTLVGVSRTVGFQPTGGVSPVLDDGTYRLAIRARVATNGWDGTIATIPAIWNSLFAGQPIYLLLHDNQDMTMTATVIGMTSTIEQDLVNNGMLLPKPEGVLLQTATPANKVFGYGLESSAFGGYSEGYWTQYTGL